jgi:hypothetical protein
MNELVITDKLNVATWNERGLGMNELELEKILEEKQVHIAVITGTKKNLTVRKNLTVARWFTLKFHKM